MYNEKYRITQDTTIGKEVQTDIIVPVDAKQVKSTIIKIK